MNLTVIMSSSSQKEVSTINIAPSSRAAHGHQYHMHMATYVVPGGHDNIPGMSYHRRASVMSVHGLSPLKALHMSLVTASA